MSYHDLSDSGMTAEERRNEATRIIKIISPLAKNPSTYAKILTQREISFINESENESRPISHKQLFWLRDLKDRLL